MATTSHGQNLSNKKILGFEKILGRGEGQAQMRARVGELRCPHNFCRYPTHISFSLLRIICMSMGGDARRADSVGATVFLRFFSFFVFCSIWRFLQDFGNDLVLFIFFLDAQFQNTPVTTW